MEKLAATNQDTNQLDTWCSSVNLDIVHFSKVSNTIYVVVDVDADVDFDFGQNFKTEAIDVLTGFFCCTFGNVLSIFTV